MYAKASRMINEASHIVLYALLHSYVWLLPHHLTDAGFTKLFGNFLVTKCLWPDFVPPLSLTYILSQSSSISVNFLLDSHGREVF